MKKNITALVLAAGFGTRLKPLTDKLPKPLIAVHGIPMIYYNLALLKKHGISRVVINLHHLGPLIQKEIGNGKKLGLDIRYSHEKKILGTGGGIRRAARFCQDTILVINGDIICNVDLDKLLKAHKKQKNQATLVLRKNRRAKDFGLLYFRKNRLVSILGNPRPNGKVEQAHFTGVHVLEKKHILALPYNQPSCIIRDLYIPLLNDDNALGAFVHKGFWSDCGTHAALIETEKAPEIMTGRIYQDTANFLQKSYNKKHIFRL